MDMASKSTSKQKPVGVIGAGSFGTAMANILAEQSPVLFFARKPEVVASMTETRKNLGFDLHENITPTGDLELLANSCEVIFPVIPSANFRELMKRLSPYLRPYHILIHGTKGLETPGIVHENGNKQVKAISRDQVKTMSEIIREESVVVRIGCLAGPNLARELNDKQPAATVVASHFDEVIFQGQRLLRNERFQVYGSRDLVGIELCGVLKNIMAIAAGALSGLGFGENAKALLISRGMVEMIHLGRMLGGNIEAFLGLAGVGDLIATSSSNLSRNHTVGYRLAKGESLEEITNTMEETAEGVNTVRILRQLLEYYGMRAPITESLYKVLYQDLTVDEALNFLMKYPMNVDIDFL